MIESELGVASSCTFQTDSLMTKIINEGNIVEIYSSSSIGTYSTNLQFYGIVVKTKHDISASTFNCLGFISILSDHDVNLSNSSNYDGYMIQDAISDMFISSDQFAWMCGHGYALEINLRAEDSIYLVNKSKENKSQIRTKGYEPAMGVYKKMMKFMYHYSSEDETPLYYYMYEKNKSIMLMREQLRSQNQCQLTIQEGMGPLVQRSLQIETLVSTTKNCCTLNSTDYDNKPISYRTTANQDYPFRTIETQSDFKSTGALKVYAEMIEKYTQKNHFSITCKIDDGWSLTVGDYAWVSSRKYTGPAIIRKMTKRIGSCDMTLGEKNIDFVSLINAGYTI